MAFPGSEFGMLGAWITLLILMIVVVSLCTTSVVVIQYILIELILNFVESEELLRHKIKYNLKVVSGRISKYAPAVSVEAANDIGL